MLSLSLSPSARRPAVLAIILFGVILLLTDLWGVTHSRLLPVAWTPSPPATTDPAVSKNLRVLRSQCNAPDPFELTYGRTNLRMTRAYEGSRARLERFVNKVIRNEPVVVGVVGGSVSKGHGIKAGERYSDQLTQVLADAYPWANITIVNGATPATGSDYYSFCFPLHIPEDVDLVFVELAVNDEAVAEHADDMDNLLRGLLELPSEPAVVLIEALALSAGVMAGVGGRIHLSVAQYYDVPVLNQRWPLVTHFARFPELIPHFFVQEWWGTDTRHIGAAGHRDMAGVIGSLLRDTTCDLILGEGYVVPPAEGFRPALPVEGYTDNSYAQQLAEQYPHLSDKRLHRLVDEVQADWPSAAHAWEHDPEDRDLEWFQIQPGKQLAPGMWPAPTENGRMPRLRAMQKWDHNVTHSNPPFHPICLSTRSTNPAFNLTPTATEGWYWWTHPEHTDKPYLAAHEPGAWATFDLDVNVGVIKLYALHSKTYGLGMIECTVDGGKGVTIDGWWNNEWLNIGRFTTLGEGLAPGRHTVNCTLLDKTSDQDGRTLFRLISVMG